MAAEDVMFPAQLRRATVASFRDQLQAAGNRLAEVPEAMAQVLHQAESVLDDVQTALTGVPAAPGEGERLSVEIGASRASRGVHPIESAHAAVTMFRVLLPVVLERTRIRGERDAMLLTAAGALQESIMHRVGIGAVAYAGFLLGKVNHSHRDERRRIGRELHDRAAHSVGVALQDLELYDVYSGTDPQRARSRIGTARTALREALDSIRELARDLRESAVEIGGLAKALDDYVATRVPDGIRTTVSVTGDEHLPDEVCEELYLVLREAVRNVVLHSGAHTLEVTVEVADAQVRATVRDDGRGFDLAAALAARSGVGLSSMRERLELLGGTFTITAVPDAGTTISIVVTHLGAHR
ncbi:sensor histidine kinase [Amycolatopsis sp. NPDC051045]|uniref:sensor histidine kinase n=1 Tax=Amycolatopsis sp. NPDC051045 TaxID=3156922 RepID=UPI0034422C89